MAFANSNDYLTGRKPAPTPAGGELVACRFTLDLLAADLALNDIGAIGILPPGVVPVDVYVDGSDMDSSTAAMIFTVGILNAAEDALSTDAADGGAAWGSTVAQNAAFYQRLTPNGRAIPSVQPSNVKRKIGLLVATAPTTAVAGSIGVTVVYRNP